MYNVTGLAENTTGIVSFISNVNTTIMSGWLGSLFLMGVFIVMFIAFYTNTADTGKSLTASLILSFFFTILLRGLNWVPDLAVWITLVGSALSLAFLWKK